MHTSPISIDIHTHTTSAWTVFLFMGLQRMTFALDLCRFCVSVVLLPSIMPLHSLSVGRVHVQHLVQCRKHDVRFLSAGQMQMACYTCHVVITKSNFMQFFWSNCLCIFAICHVWWFMWNYFRAKIDSGPSFWRQAVVSVCIVNIGWKKTFLFGLNIIINQPMRYMYACMCYGHYERRFMNASHRY